MVLLCFQTPLEWILILDEIPLQPSRELPQEKLLNSCYLLKMKIQNLLQQRVSLILLDSHCPLEFSCSKISTSSGLFFSRRLDRFLVLLIGFWRRVDGDFNGLKSLFLNTLRLEKQSYKQSYPWNNSHWLIEFDWFWPNWLRKYHNKVMMLVKGIGQHRLYSWRWFEEA